MSGARGWCLKGFESCQKQNAQRNWKQNIFSSLSCGRPRRVLPSPDPPAPESVSHHLRRHRPPSCYPDRGCATSDLSIGVLISPRLLLAVSSAVPLVYVYRQHHNQTPTGWGRWCARSSSAAASGSPPSAPSSPSPTSSPSFSVRSFLFLVHKCFTPRACLLRLTVATFSPSRYNHQTTGSCGDGALSAYATAASERQPRASCLTEQCRPSGVTITPLQFPCSGKTSFSRAVP